MLSLHRFFRPVLEWLEARLAPAALAVTPPVDASLPASVPVSIAVAVPTTPLPPAPLTANLPSPSVQLAALDALFADFAQIPPPAPEKFTLGLLEGSAQRPPVLELPPMTENVAPGAEDTALRDRVFVEAPLTVFDIHPEAVPLPDDSTPIVVAA
jgi:hypothetical protein